MTRPHPTRVVGLFCAVTLLAVVGWLGVRGVLAQRALSDARAELTTARAALLDRQLEPATAAVRAAGDDTARARRLTSDPVWRIAGSLPLLSGTFTVARGLAVAADDVARQVLPQALAAAEQVDPDRLRGPDGAIDLAVLRAASPGARRSADLAAAVQVDLEQLPRRLVVGPIADGRQALTMQTAELTGALRGAAQALDLAPTLLGQDRPRRYLLLVQQTGESRGTGGLIGGFVAVEASAGRLTVLDQGSNADLRNGPIPVPPGVPAEYVALYDQFATFDTWQNANISPDLPVVARVLTARWAAQGGQPLDGVALLDAVALAGILRGSEPLPLEAGRQVAPEKLVDYLAVGQYQDFAPTDADTDIDRSTARKDQLQEVAAVAARRLAGGGGDTLALLLGVSDAVRSGHLRMASDDPALGPALAAAGVDGALPRGDAPVAYPVVYNTTGGKLDHFLDRSVSYQAGSCTGATRRSTITVELRNDVPMTPLPPYLTIRLAGGQRTDSRTSAVALSVYGTRGASLLRASLDGIPTAPDDPAGVLLINKEEAGLPLWNLELELPPGQTRRLVLELEEPVTTGPARLPEQPLSRPLSRQVLVPACG